MTGRLERKGLIVFLSLGGMPSELSAVFLESDVAEGSDFIGDPSADVLISIDERGGAGMGKLVRDRIPEIIRQSGRTPCVTTLGEPAYRHALHDKLLEEAAELRKAQNRDEVVDEFGDLLEVLTALAATYDVTLDTITEAARTKRAERGGFEMRFWLDDR